MRQLVTEAPEVRAGDIDSFRGICKSERQITYQSSNNRAHYWQSLVIRQVQRGSHAKLAWWMRPDRAAAFPNAPFVCETGDRKGYR
jgi:hypothetical protein